MLKDLEFSFSHQFIMFKCVALSNCDYGIYKPQRPRISGANAYNRWKTEVSDETDLLSSDFSIPCKNILSLVT